MKWHWKPLFYTNEVLQLVECWPLFSSRPNEQWQAHQKIGYVSTYKWKMKFQCQHIHNALLKFLQFILQSNTGRFCWFLILFSYKSAWRCMVSSSPLIKYRIICEGTKSTWSMLMFSRWISYQTKSLLENMIMPFISWTSRSMIISHLYRLTILYRFLQNIPMGESYYSLKFTMKNVSIKQNIRISIILKHNHYWK